MENNSNQGNGFNTQDTQNAQSTQNTQNTPNYTSNGYSNGNQTSQGYSSNGSYSNQYNSNSSQYGPGYPGSGYPSYNYNNQPYGPGYPNEIEKPVSLGEWIITFIVLAIPIVNLVMLFVWGFGSDVNESKKNYCRASLIILGVVILLWIILAVVIGISAASAVSHYSSY